MFLKKGQGIARFGMAGGKKVLSGSKKTTVSFVSEAFLQSCLNLTTLSTRIGEFVE